jgi:DNA-binding response OmpR family regulator
MSPPTAGAPSGASECAGSMKPTMTQTPARVLVVDDERHIRELLEIGLGDEGFDVRSAPDGQVGLQICREWSPDAIVLDVMLPKVDGISLLPMFRKLTEAPILMLSAKSDVRDKVAGLSGGADDYVAKPFEMAELLARLETALRRPRLAQPQVLRFGDLEVNLETRIVARDGKTIALSAREYDLLVVLLRNPQRVFSRDQLLDQVWGADRFVGPGAVETYISYLRAKIDQGFATRLIHTHRGAGYSLREA